MLPLTQSFLYRLSTWGFLSKGEPTISSHLIDYQKAAEIILLGEKLDSQTVERIGLVNKIICEADLLDKALETARRLAKKPPESIQAAKALLKRGGGRMRQPPQCHVNWISSMNG